MKRQTGSVQRRGSLGRKSGAASKNTRGGGRQGGSLVRFATTCLWLGGTTVFLVAVSWGLLAGYRYLTSHPYFTLREVSIEGNERLTDTAVLQLAGITPGENSLAVDMGRAKNRLMQNPWVERVLLRRILPDKVQIHVQERKAVFWVRKQDGLYFADRRGEAIAPVSRDRFVSLPLLDLGKQQEHRETVALFADRLQQRRLPFSAAEVDWVRFDSEFVLETQLRDSGPRVVLETHDLARHCQKLLAVWRDLNERDELDEASSLVFFRDKAWARF